MNFGNDIVDEVIIVGYYQSEISHEILINFLNNHGIDDPCVLGNILLLPKHLKELFCDTFGIIFLNKISTEMVDWCGKNIKSKYSIHGSDELISQKYILIENKDDRFLFKLTWAGK